MLREKLKLSLLLGCFLLCMGSLFTSHKSFQMGPRDLPTLTPQVAIWCKSIYKLRNACRKKPQPECAKITQQSSQCESAVQKAYRTINMGGCPYQLRDATLCELERCGGYHGISVLNTGALSSSVLQPNLEAVEGCQHHCDAVRKQLETCIRNNVQHQLKRYGIQVQQQG